HNIDTGWDALARSLVRTACPPTLTEQSRRTLAAFLGVSMSPHPSLDHESFQKLLASAYSVQESGMDTQSLSALLELDQLIAMGEPDVDRVMHLVADRARNVANAAGIAIAVRRGDQLVYRAGSGCAASYVG